MPQPPCTGGGETAYAYDGTDTCDSPVKSQRFYSPTPDNDHPNCGDAICDDNGAWGWEIVITTTAGDGDDGVAVDEEVPFTVIAGAGQNNVGNGEIIANGALKILERETPDNLYRVQVSSFSFTTTGECVPDWQTGNEQFKWGGE